MEKLNLNSKLALNQGGNIPVLGLGVWQMSAAEVIHAAQAAFEIGYRHIDTASIYRNEEGVGEAIKRSSLERDELFITTKLANDEHDHPEQALHRSLEKLGLQYVDLYLIHWPVPGMRGDSWQILERLHQQGIAKAIGVSNYTTNHLQELLATANVVPAVNQVEFSPFLYQRELLEFCSSHSIVVEGYSPLTKGRHLGDSTIEAIAKRHHKTSAQVMLRWAVQHGVVTIPKSTRPERIKENADIFDFGLDETDMVALDGLNQNLRTTWDPTNVR